MFRAIQITASNHFVHFFSLCFICAPFFFSFSFNLNYNLKESHIENFEKKKKTSWKFVEIFFYSLVFFFLIYIYIFFSSLPECDSNVCNKKLRKNIVQKIAQKVHIRFSADVRVGKTVFYDTFIRHAQIFLYDFDFDNFIKTSIYSK